MAHIRKTASGRFEARFRGPDGTEHAKRFTTRRDAQTFLDRLGVDRQAGRWRDPRAGKMLFADWVQLWQPNTVDLRPSTRARDDSYLRNHVLPRFGTLRLDAITPLEVRSWVADLTASGLAPATVQKAYQILSKTLRSAVDADLLAETPCRRVPLPKVETDEMQFISPQEIRTLSDHINPRYRALVLFDAYCGLRLSELAGLRRSALNPGLGRVRVTENAVEVRGTIEWGIPKTRAGRRTVPIPSAVASALNQHLDHYVDPEPGSLVFGGPDGGVLRAGSWRSRFWNPAIRAAGLGGLRIHDLRHTAVALWIAAGASPKQIATWAGHTSVSVVLDRYGHLYEGNDTDVLTRLDSFASVTSDDAPSRWIPRVFRGANDHSDDQPTGAQVADLRKYGGREGTRTPGLCRVKVNRAV
ncbi:MAG: tyrosine-type recombinase/integrase [Acidimicrobiia bacterium]